MHVPNVDQYMGIGAADAALPSLLLMSTSAHSAAREALMETSELCENWKQHPIPTMLLRQLTPSLWIPLGCKRCLSSLSYICI